MQCTPLCACMSMPVSGIESTAGASTSRLSFGESDYSVSNTQAENCVMLSRFCLYFVLTCTNAPLLRCGALDDSRHETAQRTESSQGNAERTHVFKEGIPQLSSRRDLERKGRLAGSHIHEVVFAIKPNNMEELTRILHDVSDPVSENYGQHMTRNEVRDLTSNPVANLAVTSYLEAIGATVVSESLDGEYITATAPIHTWEKMFHAEFHTFEQKHVDGGRSGTIRAEEYWIPKELHEHVEYVMNVIDISFSSEKGYRKDSVDGGRKLLPKIFDNRITPLKLRAAYNMSDSHGSKLST